MRLMAWMFFVRVWPHLVAHGYVVDALLIGLTVGAAWLLSTCRRWRN